MAKKEHGPLYHHAQEELKFAGLIPDGKAPAELSIYHTTLKLVDTFEKGSVNDFTSKIIKGLFMGLSDGLVINDPTNNPAEWKELDGRIVNVRDNRIFTNDEGKSWFRIDNLGQQSGVSKDVTVKDTSNGSKA